MRDVVRNLFHRVGTVGVILLASALLFGVLAGAVLVHRLDTVPTASNESTQGGNAGQQSDKKTQPPKSKQTQPGQSAAPEQDD